MGTPRLINPYPDATRLEQWGGLPAVADACALRTDAWLRKRLIVG